MLWRCTFTVPSLHCNSLAIALFRSPLIATGHYAFSPYLRGNGDAPDAPPLGVDHYHRVDHGYGDLQRHACHSPPPGDIRVVPGW